MDFMIISVDICATISYLTCLAIVILTILLTWTQQYCHRVTYTFTSRSTTPSSFSGQLESEDISVAEAARLSGDLSRDEISYRRFSFFLRSRLVFGLPTNCGRWLLEGTNTANNMKAWPISGRNFDSFFRSDLRSRIGLRLPLNGWIRSLFLAR